MNRRQIGTLLTAVAGASFLATAALHTTGYGSVTGLAAQSQADLQQVVPALWLVFAFNLAVVGLIVLVVAFRPTAPGRLILVIAAFCPFGAAGLQLWFLGFIPPTAILLAVGGLTLVAAAALPKVSVPPTR
jgi:hypothetical protein